MYKFKNHDTGKEERTSMREFWREIFQEAHDIYRQFNGSIICWFDMRGNLNRQQEIKVLLASKKLSTRPFAPMMPIALHDLFPVKDTARAIVHQDDDKSVTFAQNLWLMTNYGKIRALAVGRAYKTDIAAFRDHKTHATIKGEKCLP